MPEPTTEAVNDFIARWEKAGASERSNYQLFLTELCDLLEVPHPDPATPDNTGNLYTFDRAVTRSDKDGKTGTVFIDLYKAGHFVLETKQGASLESSDDNTAKNISPKPLRAGHGRRGTKTWDKALDKAYHQARGYIRDLPADDGRPPFLIVCDVGHLIELYEEFTCTGGQYLRLPDPKNHRIYLEDLRNPDKRRLLRTIWTDPLSLDPSKHSAKVTRDIASVLAKLAASLEKGGHEPDAVALFLQRCLFTLFAEDIGLLPAGGFENLLNKVKDKPEGFTVLATNLWKEMSVGTDFSAVLMEKITHFNGGLFDNPSALALDGDQITLLLHAAKQDWTDVEPAIFGTLLERALDPRERHKLGAHHTPRSYVERLIHPTLMQPLRERWAAVKAAAAQHHDSGDTTKARNEIQIFHRQLTEIRVLDPACGSGNFLYVALARMKELEAEVLDVLEELGGNRTLEMDTLKVRPAQFWGLEINEKAVAIAQLVLWIGYFQWHHKTTGDADTNDRPLLPKQNTILQQDAVLAYDEKLPRLDDGGNVLTIWDGLTTKPHPVTGKEVPDQTALKTLFDFTNPHRPEWPQADYIIGNPPFLGTSRMREALGDGYTEAVREAWKGAVPESADFVMYWWQKAAELVRNGKARRFGLITTNSIHQTFNRRVIEPLLATQKAPLHIAYAIPDHPWIDSADGAAVRIAMTVAAAEKREGILETVVFEVEREDGEHDVVLRTAVGSLAPNLKIGADVTTADSLISNLGLSCPGVKLHGSGFIVTADEAECLGIGQIRGLENHIRSYRNGRDLTQRPRGVFVIDLYGLTADDACRRFPAVYQHVYNHVKPNRDGKGHTKDGAGYAEKWWLFGKVRESLRESLAGLPRFIATVETSKHRFFVFLDRSILPDNKLISIALKDAYYLGVLSSSVHVMFALDSGSRLGVGNDPVYVKTRCFETFPFPCAGDDDTLDQAIRDLGERLDAHRKARQAEYPDLTMTGMYNVLERLRKGEGLNGEEKVIHDEGLVTILKQIHDDLDTAVLEAYGWTDLTTEGPIADRLAQGDDGLEQELLQRLVDLNRERAAEEAKGKIRYLRPEFQDPERENEEAPFFSQKELSLAAAKKKGKKGETLTWPKDLPSQVAVVQKLLPSVGQDLAEFSRAFGRTSKKREQQIAQILQTLESLGQL